MVDGLWHGLFGGNSNGAFWILGGDADNPVKGPNGAWSAAIDVLCDSNQPPLEKNKSQRAFDKAREKAYRERPFNPFDSFLSVSGLIGYGRGGRVLSAVYNIYRWTESLTGSRKILGIIHLN